MIRKIAVVVALGGLGLVVFTNDASAGLFRHRHRHCQQTVACEQSPPGCTTKDDGTTGSAEQSALSAEELAKIKKEAEEEAKKQPALSAEELAKIKKEAEEEAKKQPGSEKAADGK